MTTIKSFSSQRFHQVFISALRGQVSAMVAIMIVLLLAIQVPLINDLLIFHSARHSMDVFTLYLFHSAPHSMDVNTTLYLLYPLSGSMFIHALVGIFALGLALFANSYMHSKRSVDLYHSIPVTRRELLTANFAASMVTLLAPYFANALIALVIQAVGYGGAANVDFSGLFLAVVLDWLGIMIYAAVVYLFVAFIAAHVGTVFDTLAASGVVGFSALLIYGVSGSIWAELAYGAHFTGGEHILLLSPFLFIFYKWSYIGRTGPIGTVGSFASNEIWLFYLFGAIAAVALYFATVRAYERRKSEIAQQAQASGVFQTIVKMVAAFAGAAIISMMLLNAGWVAQAVGAVAGAVLLGVVAELVMSRGVRHLRGNFKWLAGTGLACGLAIASVALDVTGFVSRVPDPANVQSVHINYEGRTAMLNPQHRRWQGNELILPESIEIVTNTHKTWVGQYEPSHSYGPVVLEYKLKNGATLRRRYSSVPSESMEMLAALEEKSDFIMSSLPIFDDSLVEMITGVNTYNSLRSESARLHVYDEDLRKLIEAVQNDMLNETLEEMKNPSAPALGYISFVVDTYSMVLDGRMEQYVDYVNVLVTHEYVNTIALLKELGHYDRMIGPEYAPDKVYIMEHPRNYWGGSRIIALSPDDDDYYYQDIYRSNWHDDELITQTQEEVDQIVANAANQMFINDSAEKRDGIKVYLAIFTTGGKINGSLLIRESDLPARMREVLEKRYRPLDVHH